MNEVSLSEEEIQKYAQFVNMYLEKEEGLAGILIRLKNKGLSNENAKYIVKEVAKVHTSKINQKAKLSLFLGLTGVIVFGILGISSKGGLKYFIFAILSLFGGYYQYNSSRKRLKYLNSID